MSISEENPGAGSGGQVRRRRRRRWSEAQKRQIVAETCEPGVSVPMVAQRYNLNANQIFRWRRLFREAERAAGAGRFVPVVVEAAPGQEPDAATMSPPSERAVPIIVDNANIEKIGGSRGCNDCAGEWQRRRRNAFAERWRRGDAKG